MKRSGFTLIEFLIVAALLGIIMTIGLSTYQRSLSRGRDIKRVTDMEKIKKSFELYYSLNGTYNSNCAEMFTDQTSSQPQPPSGGLAYFGLCTQSDYWYCTRLENGVDYGNYVCDADSSSANCDQANSNQTHFCVFNVQ